MKNIFFIFVLFSLQVFGDYLIVDDESLNSASTDGVTVQLNSFQPSSMALQINHASGELAIPIYVKTDSSEAIYMNLNSISPLKQGTDEIITTMIFRNSSNVETTINANSDFTIHSGSTNDGTSKVGDIIIKVAQVPTLATHGTYSLSSNAKVKIGGGSYSSPNTLNSTATVAKVAMVNIGDSSDVSNEITGVDFKDSTIGFGNFQLNQVNSIIKNLYLKSNTNGDISLRFETKKLTSTIDSQYQIGLNYEYKKTSDSSYSAIPNNTNFTIYSDKNDGTNKVGEMKFSTEALTGSLIAGGYEATITVRVTAQ